MGNKNDNWWRGVPWGWVSVSVYGTALGCVAVSQMIGPDAALDVVRDYQTLIAGTATIAALFIAVQQLKRQASRDAVDASRHHQVETDALMELGRLASGLARRSSQPYEGEMSFDQSRWERLRHAVHVSLTPAISDLMGAIQAHNRLLEDAQTPYLSLHRVDESQLRQACVRVHNACRYLLEVTAMRQSAVHSLIETTS